MTTRTALTSDEIRDALNQQLKNRVYGELGVERDRLVTKFIQAPNPARYKTRFSFQNAEIVEASHVTQLLEALSLLPVSRVYGISFQFSAHVVCLYIEPGLNTSAEQVEAHAMRFFDASLDQYSQRHGMSAVALAWRLLPQEDQPKTFAGLLAWAMVQGFYCSVGVWSDRPGCEPDERVVLLKMRALAQALAQDTQIEAVAPVDQVKIVIPRWYMWTSGISTLLSCLMAYVLRGWPGLAVMAAVSLLTGLIAQRIFKRREPKALTYEEFIRAGRRGP